MHELALVEGIIELVAASARLECMARVTRVSVEIGAGAAVDPDALRFCFPMAAADTAVAGADLVIDLVAIQAQCGACRTLYAPDTVHDPCPACGGFGGKIIAGRDMRVVSFHGA